MAQMKIEARRDDRTDGFRSDRKSAQRRHFEEARDPLREVGFIVGELASQNPTRR
jgi:hypothetical protein